MRERRLVLFGVGYKTIYLRMTSLKVQLTQDSTISLSTTDKTANSKDSVKITITKDEIIRGPEKGILKKTQVSLTVEEYNLLKLSLPALDGILHYYACSKQFHN